MLQFSNALRLSGGIGGVLLSRAWLTKPRFPSKHSLMTSPPRLGPERAGGMRSYSLQCYLRLAWLFSGSRGKPASRFG